MSRFISPAASGRLLIAALSVMLAVHLLIVFQVLPYEFVWGGQIKDSASLLVFEGIAIVTTLVFIAVTALKAGLIRVPGVGKVIVSAGMWIMFGYLALNTVGNLASGVTLEKLLFTPVTVVLALLAYRLATHK